MLVVGKTEMDADSKETRARFPGREVGTVNYTFDDVLIKPKFSSLSSRNDADLSTTINGDLLRLPVLSANMSTITGAAMATAMIKAGGMGVLHRFCGIYENWQTAREVLRLTDETPWISVGISQLEWSRVKEVAQALETTVVIDVAHGAQQQVADFFKKIREEWPSSKIVVGNFATGESIVRFVEATGYAAEHNTTFKIGIGPGSACTTRIKTGCGVPQLSAIRDCASTGYPIIADGGMKTPGDIAKALAAGAKAVMLGGMLAGTDEAASNRYYGSASVGQKPDGRHIEGEVFEPQQKGPVDSVLKDIEDGLKSAFAYVGAKTLREFQQNAELIPVSPSTQFENGAHYGK